MFNVVCDRISLETYGVFYVSNVLLWMQSESHTEHHEIACHVLFSVVICLSLQVANRIFNIWCTLWYWVSRDVCAAHNHMLTLNCFSSFSQSWQTMSMNHIFQSIRITLVSTKTLSSILIFLLPFYSVMYLQSEVYLFIRHKPGRAESSDAVSQFHYRGIFCKWDPQ